MNSPLSLFNQKQNKTFGNPELSLYLVGEKTPTSWNDAVILNVFVYLPTLRVCSRCSVERHHSYTAVSSIALSHWFLPVDLEIRGHPVRSRACCYVDCILTIKVATLRLKHPMAAGVFD